MSLAEAIQACTKLGALGAWMGTVELVMAVPACQEMVAETAWRVAVPRGRTGRGVQGGRDTIRETREMAPLHTPSPPPYSQDPDAPYFEHLFALIRDARPTITRAEALALIHTVDPGDTLRISLPVTGDGVDTEDPK